MTGHVGPVVVTGMVTNRNLFVGLLCGAGEKRENPPKEKKRILCEWPDLPSLKITVLSSSTSAPTPDASDGTFDRDERLSL